MLHTYQWQRCDAARRQLRRHRRRDEHHLRPHRRRHRPRRARRGHRRQRRRHRLRRVDRRRPRRARPARQRHRPDDHRAPPRRARPTAHDGTWTGSAPMTATYQWQRCDTAGANCADIAGATDDTYTLEDADAGHTMRVSVTATNAAGTDTARSAPTAVVDGTPPANTVAPLALRHRPRRRDADARRRRLDRHADDHLRLPVAALRRGRRQLRRHRRRHRPHLRPAGADVGDTVRAVVTATNAYGDDSSRHRPERRRRRRAPGRHDRARRHRHRRSTARPSRPTPASGPAPRPSPTTTSGCAATSTARTASRSPAPPTTSTRSPAPTPTTASASRSPPPTPRGSVTEVSPVAAVDAAAPQNTALPTVSGTYADGRR